MKILFFLSSFLVFEQLVAQKPMSFNELKFPVDSILTEQEKLHSIYCIISKHDYLDIKKNKSILSYIVLDTVYFMELSEDNVVKRQFSFLLSNLNLVGMDNDYRLLKNFEIDILNTQQLLIEKFNFIENDSSYNFIFLNELGLYKMYAYRNPKSTNEIPFTNNYLLKSIGNDIELKKYHDNRNTTIEILKENGDTTLWLSMKTAYPDKYIYPMDIFIFRVFRPDWWMRNFSSYSRVNKRKFIYNVDENKIQIVKFPNE